MSDDLLNCPRQGHASYLVRVACHGDSSCAGVGMLLAGHTDIGHVGRAEDEWDGKSSL